MSQYPDEIYTPRVKENRSGITYDPEKKTVIFAEDLILYFIFFHFPYLIFF